ncbi:hypothetical protein CXG81DRAFT_24812 [Caulochytrium protostelioides]|uniref:SHSP domain-containing protein n=1 Tax=Caulochytrium protostelioides TaxID=1555241 RepID=A0A4P9XB05_9FUNG|nr:hypothetical protein CXG81DRAFT_24812 [Caulochytrium protostelioides]|eukprot:RKP02525.1 hypothetical protein CXG81DRAFT_24812 [Caulochytrium protostelioides]
MGTVPQADVRADLAEQQPLSVPLPATPEAAPAAASDPSYLARILHGVKEMSADALTNAHSTAIRLRPGMHLRHTEHVYVYLMDMPGVHVEAVDVTVTGDILLVEAEVACEPREDHALVAFDPSAYQKDPLCVERHFHASLLIPNDALSHPPEISLFQGVLRIVMDRTPPDVAHHRGLARVVRVLGSALDETRHWLTSWQAAPSGPAASGRSRRDAKGAMAAEDYVGKRGPITRARLARPPVGGSPAAGVGEIDDDPALRNPWWKLRTPTADDLDPPETAAT